MAIKENMLSALISKISFDKKMADIRELFVFFIVNPADKIPLFVIEERVKQIYYPPRMRIKKLYLPKRVKHRCDYLQSGRFG